MKPKIKDLGKPLSRERLAAVEAEYDLSLPPAYRAFLLENNGGTPDPDTFRRRGKKALDYKCDSFLGIDTGSTDLVWALDIMHDKDEPRMPQRLLPIANAACGDFICLSVRGPDRGKVYCWFHEDELGQERTSSGDVDDSAIILLADSFELFLEQFDEDPEARKQKARQKSWQKMISSGDIDGFRAWLEAGGNINEKTKDGTTPLVQAVYDQQYEIVGLLLDRGASFESAAQFASDNCDWTLLRRLLHRSPRALLKLEPSVFEHALQFCDDVSFIEALLDAGAPLNARMRHGNVLHSATDELANPKVVKLLLDRGAKPGQYGYLGQSALSNAIVAGNLETVKLLLDAGEQLYVNPKEAKANWDSRFWSKVKHYELASPADCLSEPRGKKIKAAVVAYAAQLGQRP